MWHIHHNLHKTEINCGPLKIGLKAFSCISQLMTAVQNLREVTANRYVLRKILRVIFLDIFKAVILICLIHTIELISIDQDQAKLQQPFHVLVL